jgi:hypothetical protein
MERHSGVSSNNRAAFRAVFRQFVLLCRRLDLYDRELVAVDGTRINKDRNYTRSSLREFIPDADERLSDYLERLDRRNSAGTTAVAREPRTSKNSRPCARSAPPYKAMPARLEYGRAYEGRRRLQRSDRGRRQQ